MLLSEMIFLVWYYHRILTTMKAGVSEAVIGSIDYIRNYQCRVLETNIPLLHLKIVIVIAIYIDIS